MSWRSGQQFLRGPANALQSIRDLFRRVVPRISLATPMSCGGSGWGIAEPSTTCTNAFAGPRSRSPAILGDDVLAEDVLQEVFLSVWRNPSAYDRARGSFASWLLAVVHHKAVDAVRREESTAPPADAWRDDLALDAPSPTRDVEDEAWPGWSPNGCARPWVCCRREREALTLAYYGGYTQRESRATGAPLGTVKTRMLAGMRRLRRSSAGRPPAGTRRPRRGETDERPPRRGDHDLRRARRRLGAARARARGRGGLRRAPARLCPLCRDRRRADRGHGRARADLPPAEPSDELRTGCAPPSRGPSRLAPPPRRRAAPAPDRRPAPATRRRPRTADRPPAGLLRRAGGRGGRRIVGLGVWNVILSEDRRELRRRSRRRGGDGGAADPGGRRSPPSDDQGHAVATVVARGRVQVVSPRGWRVNDRPAPATSSGAWRRGRVPLGTFDVPGSQMDAATVGSGHRLHGFRVRHQPRARPGAPSAPTEVVATGQVTS